MLEELDACTCHCENKLLHFVQPFRFRLSAVQLHWHVLEAAATERNIFWLHKYVCVGPICLIAYIRQRGVSDLMIGPSDESEEICGDEWRRVKDSRCDFACSGRECSRQRLFDRFVRYECPCTWIGRGEKEDCFDVWLIEVGEDPVGVVGFTLRVDILLLVLWIDIAMQAAPIISIDRRECYLDFVHTALKQILPLESNERSIPLDHVDCALVYF